MSLTKPTHINLGGNKADSSLVDMAFKIKDAATPADMSNIYARMADSYDRTMRGNAAMWGNLIKSVTPLLEETAKNWGEFSRYKTRVDRPHFNSANGMNIFINGGEETIGNPDFDPSSVDGGFMERVQTGPLEEAKQNLPSEVPTFEEWVKQDPVGRQGATQEDYKEAYPNTKPKQALPKNTRYDTNGNPEFITRRTLGLNDISAGLRETWNPIKGNPRSKENKQKRRELHLRKEQIFKDIDLLEAGFESIAKNLGNNNYYRDAMFTDSASTRLLNAIGTLHNPSGKTKNGDYIQMGYDDEQRMVLRLFNKNGDKVLKNKNNPDSDPIEIKANDLGNVLTPKLNRSGKKPYNKLWKDYIAVISKKNANAIEASNGFKNNLRDLVTDKTELHKAMHEKHFLNFQTSFTDDIMGANGRRSDLSATIFQALKDINGATNGTPNLPADPEGNPIDIDISGGTDPNALDEMDFSGDGVGLKNYSKVASALTNRNSEFYNEDTTRGVFLHWADQKAQEKALIAQGKTPPPKVPGKGTAMKMDTDSSVMLQKIIYHAKTGNFDMDSKQGPFLMPKLKTDSGKEYGEMGRIHWVDGDGSKNPGYFSLEQNNKSIPLVGDKDIRTNKGLYWLMNRAGVSLPHMNEMANMGLWKNPLFNMPQHLQLKTNKSAAPDSIRRPAPGGKKSETYDFGFEVPKGPTNKKKSVDDYMKQFSIE